MTASSHRIFHLYQRQHQKEDTLTQRKHLVDTVLTRGDTHKVIKQKPASNQKRANAWCDDYACAWTPTWPINWWASVSLKSMKIFMVSWNGILVLVCNSMLWFLLYRIQNYGSMTLFVLVFTHILVIWFVFFGHFRHRYSRLSRTTIE